MRQASLFESERLTLEQAIELSIQNLQAIGQHYAHWSIAYSGGKDSTATTALVCWAIRAGLVPKPESLTILYADTRLELPILQNGAFNLLRQLSQQGFKTQVVLPKLDDRFFIYMLGRGVPPPKNTFRWCTSQLKIEPMMAALLNLRQQTGQKLLSITGVRLGESAARDQRIALSCSKDSGECGQGWLQISTKEAVADTFAPLVHWRLCHVYDWLYFDNRHGYDVSSIAEVYGDGEVRTGCVACNLASRDVALERLIRNAKFEHLKPLLELKSLYLKLKSPKNRKRKSQAEKRKDGQYSKNVQRMGPLTMEARAWGLEMVKDIQQRAKVDLINEQEEARIRELWAANTWPNKWNGNEINGSQAIDKLRIVDNLIIAQNLLSVF